MTAAVCGLGRLDVGLDMDVLLQEFDWLGFTIANGIVTRLRQGSLAALPADAARIETTPT